MFFLLGSSFQFIFFLNDKAPVILLNCRKMLIVWWFPLKTCYGLAHVVLRSTTGTTIVLFIE